MPAHKYLPLGDRSVHLVHGGRTSLPTEAPSLGAGTACVLVHDAGGSAGTWGSFVEAFGPDVPWVAVDQPGHGRSGGVVGPADVKGWARTIRDLLGWLGGRRVVLVGWGLGGAAVLECVRNGAAGVVGTVLLGVGDRVEIPGGLTGILRDVVRGRRPQHFGTEGFAKETSIEVMKVAWTEQVRTDPRVWLQDVELLEACDVAALAVDVAVPTLVVTGASDRFVAPEAAEGLAAAIDGARVEIVRDAGHQLPIEQPAALAGIVRDFLGGLS